MNNRSLNRRVYLHYLSIRFESDFSRGNLNDISNFGFQFSSNISLEEGEFGIRLHIEKDKNVGHAPEIWTREGDKRWSKKAKGGFLIGVQLNPELDKLPEHHKVGLQGDPNYVTNLFTTYDMCQLFIFPKSLAQR